MSELVKAEDSPYSGYSPDQVSIIKSQIFPGCTDLELQWFLITCKRTRLDPFTKQIYAIHRNRRKQGTADQFEKYVAIQTSIDGFRVVASRYTDFAGSDEPKFEYAEGDFEKKVPVSATVNVYKINQITGERYVAAVGYARWDEYFPEKEREQKMWKRMPHGQLAKCAEALALRKAFPNDLSNIYTDDEMAQSPDAAFVPDAEENREKEMLLNTISNLLMDDRIPEPVREKVRKNYEFMSRGSNTLLRNMVTSLESYTTPKHNQ